MILREAPRKVSLSLFIIFTILNFIQYHE